MSEVLQQTGRTYVLQRGRKLIYFAGCDYFRLASHPQVLKAVKAGLDRYGLNVAASRRTTGNHELYGKLENALAKFFGNKNAILTSNGYVTNLAVAQGLAGQFEHAFIDERAHACLQDAAPMLGCLVTQFTHRSPDSLLKKWRDAGEPKQCVILTDGMFAHDGSLAPLRDYLAVLPKEAMLLVDDAHAAGVMGAKGRGSAEHGKIPRERVIQTATLSKAFGVYGGVILAPPIWHEHILIQSRLLMGNTPLPLPLANGCLASVKVMERGARMRKQLLANIKWMRKELAAAGVSSPETLSPIFPIMPSSQEKAETLKKALLKAGIYPPFIWYPGGPENGYFRFAISSEHTREQMGKLVAALKVVSRMK